MLGTLLRFVLVVPAILMGRGRCRGLGFPSALMDSLGGGMGGEMPGLSRDKGRRDAMPGGVTGGAFALASMLATTMTGDIVNVGDSGSCPGALGVVGLAEAASSGTVRGMSCAMS